jgi:formamidopyrimidine-DNA glycosylase
VPELPEVEVTRRAIAPLLVGRTIKSVTTTKPSYFFLTPPRALRERLPGRKFVEVVRVGKYLVASLDDDSRLLLHLGMTGQLFSSEASSPRLYRVREKKKKTGTFRPDEHTHLVLSFRDPGPDLLFRDVRKFGKVRHLAPGKNDVRLTKLGVDALEVDGEVIFAAAKRRITPVKSLLLDQSVIAGAGNIYADEALFLAKIRPTRRARSVTREECDALAKALRGVLRRAIVRGGSSIDDFVNPDGSDGDYQTERKVYAREGEPCPRCRTTIRRTVIGQRSSHYCPGCQR